MLKNVFTVVSFFLFVLAPYKASGANRVPDVEAQIKKDVAEFFERLYPGSKYSLEVEITPRGPGSMEAGSDELPFFDFEDMEGGDPWENSELSVYALYGKIKSVKIAISLEENLKILNREGLEQKLLRDIRLIPGRDKVEFSIMDSPYLEKRWASIFENHFYVTSFLMALAVLICGLLIVGVLNKKLNLNQGPQAQKEEKDASPTSRSTSMPFTMEQNSYLKEKSSFGEGSISLSDPTKSLKLVGEKISEVLESEVFPLLSDMIVLEKLLFEDVRAFSQLVYEFPVDTQDKIYCLGRGERWYKGFSEIGELSPKVLFALETMLRNRRPKVDAAFESLLIQCWRMGEQCEDFLRELQKDEAILILSHLPKFFSIPLARKILPGGWGVLLGNEKSEVLQDINRTQQLIAAAREVCPELSRRSLDLYLNRQDLLDYLGVCEVNEEQEIYLISAKETGLLEVRPPFYLFFDLASEDMVNVFNSLSLEQWALILFNVPRAYRKKIDAVLSQKERFLLGSFLSQLDQTKPDLVKRGQLRKMVGRAVADLESRKTTFQEQRELANVQSA